MDGEWCVPHHEPSHLLDNKKVSALKPDNQISVIKIIGLDSRNNF